MVVSRWLTRRTRLVAVGVLLTGVGFAPVVAGVGPVAAISPDVVISQVYGGGGNSGATYTHDFVELHNRGPSSVSLDGWSVQYAAATGAQWQVTPLAGTLAAGGYLLVRQAAGAAGTTPLPAPDVVGSTAMSATAGKVALRTTTNPLTCATGCTDEDAVRDLVGYGPNASSFEGTGPAPALANATAGLRAGDGAVDTDQNATDVTAGTPRPRSRTAAPGVPPLTVRIHQLQGRSHLSPLDGREVTGVPGVVTAVAANGYYLQDPTPDADPRTSEAVLVFTGSAPAVRVGDAVTVSGRVAEFRPGGADGVANLTTTEIISPRTTVVSRGNPLPAPTLLGTAGRTPPTTVIDTDEGPGNDVETSGAFDPARDAIDFYESLEGMRVRIDRAVAVGPTNSHGELPVVADRGRGAGPRSARGGVVLRPDDPNPERIVLDDGLGVATPVVNVSAVATGSAVGVVSYSFGNVKVLLTAPVAFGRSPLRGEVARPEAAGELSIGTFNVENLDPADPPEKFRRLAGIIVENLRAPDVLALEEVQDDTGPTNDGTVTAARTYQVLIEAIEAAGGPTYRALQIDPVNNQDGGEPGGNIRVGFLYAPERGVSVAEAPAGDATTPAGVTVRAGQPWLTHNPGRIAPANAAWQNSRKPLAAQFRFQGRDVFVIANHFVSKGGDQPLFGRFQPPERPSEEQREAQARLVHDFAAQILAVDPRAAVAVVGDLNDFEFSDTVAAVAGAELVNLPATLPVAERYTYVYDGNSQVLDHILLSRGLLPGHSYDIVHVNAEFADQASDHDPQLVRLRLPTR